MVAAKSTATQLAYEKVRVLLLSGGFAPGQKLHINNLAERLEISAGIVREALARLTSENLVTSEPQRGFRAALISQRDLIELTEARIEIERLCLSKALEIGGRDWDSQVRAAYQKMSVIPETDRSGGVSARWNDAHEEFHEALAAGCGNEWLLRIRAGLSLHFRRYRQLSMDVSRDNRAIDDEHRAIAEAVISRNRERSLGLLTEHLTTTTKFLLNSLPPSDLSTIRATDEVP